MEVVLFDLERFVTAQDANDSYNTALQEIKDGWKRSQWMWYVFPQIQGLGHSSTSRKYSIKSLLEAQAYLVHDTLGKRLYEVMDALPIHGDAEEIFGKVDAMKLRSCLTLFDLVSPDEIFADFLQNYFNGERCQKTLEIVSSELSYYRGDDAFRRNGIHEVPRAFLEGIDGSKQLTYNNRIGTLLDLLGRGETMRMLVSRHLWNKSDFSAYRISSIKNQILVYMRSIFIKIADKANDDVLLKEMKAIYGRYELADDCQLLKIADAIDMFWREHCSDMRVKTVIDTLTKDSLCKPIEKAGVRIYNGVVRPEYTPDAISSLRADEVFVFGSNLHGHHGGGAARVARRNFGAIWGQGVGLQGQSYAIPTMQGGAETIKPYVDQFIDFAKDHSEMFFYVTRIGCGIAGFKDSDIAPLFKDAIETANICLPKSFVGILKNKEIASKVNVVKNTADVLDFCCPKYKMLSEYGYIRTIADIIKVLNQSNCYTDPETLEHDLQMVLEHYRERGTVSQSSIEAFRCLIHDYSTILFDGNKLDIDVLAHIIEKIPYEGRNPIEEVFSIRQKAKILYAVKFANRICKYTNPNDLIYDIQGLFLGKSTWGWSTALLDDDHPHTNYGVRFFLDNISKAWASITYVDEQSKKATLSNDLLESYMFTNHEKKIIGKGLVSTLKEDYEEVSGCHSTRLQPKRPGSGPIYVVNDDKRIQKACHPSDDTLIQQEFYEKGFVSVLMRNLVSRHEYREVEGGRDIFFLPVRDYSRPIYDGNYNEMSFESEEQKIKFIKSLR
jgi:uncharacterized protein (DUF1810 family)